MATRASRASAAAGPRDEAEGDRGAILSLDLPPNTVLRRLLVAVTVLTAASVAGQVLLHEAPSLPLVGGIAHALYVDSEQSLPTVFAVFLIAVVAALLATIAALSRRTGSPDTWYWAAAAVLGTVLALDEYLSLHEQLIDPLRAVLGSGPAGLLHYAWVVPGALAVVVATLVFVPFLRRLPRRLRRLVLLSGGLYVLGAIGMEIVGGAIENATGDRGSYLYLAATTFEETLEVVAVAVLLFALLDHLAAVYGTFTVTARVQDLPQA